jgi:hypothetical protein
VCWILFLFLPIPIVSKRTQEPLSWGERLIFAGIGIATLVLWYSLPAK